MKSPKNKMMSTEDMDTKAERKQARTATGQAVPEGARIPFEGQHEKQRFWFPQYQLSVEADSLEEAEQIAKEKSSNQR